MVEQQIRPWEVLDDRILNLYYDLPRDAFVAPELRTLAYSDMQLPCGEGQLMLEPKLEARMLQELAPQEHERILHIGTGSGFFAALLGRLAAQVTTVEIRPALAQAATERLRSARADNVEVATGDGFGEFPARGPYSAVVLTGSTPVLPEQLFDRHAPGGRMLALVGTEPVATLQRAIRLAERSRIDSFVEAWAPPLANAPRPSRFVF